MNDLVPERVAARLETNRLGRSLELKATTESTNDDARRRASEGVCDGHVVVADTQTRGRGSRGRTWLSPAGTDLYFSIVAHVELPPENVPPLTLAVGLAAAEALEALLPRTARASVKWPNDVWVGRKKLAGVLVESASLGLRLEPLVIGLGVNVNRTTFPADLEVPASSLALESGCALDRSLVLAGLLNRLEPWLDRFVREGPEPVVAALALRLALAGEWASCGGVVGMVEGIAPSGALLLRTATGLATVTSGTLRAHDEPSSASA